MKIPCLNESCDNNTGFTHECMYAISDALIDAYKNGKIECEHLKDAIEDAESVSK